MEYLTWNSVQLNAGNSESEENHYFASYHGFVLCKDAALQLMKLTKIHQGQLAGDTCWSHTHKFPYSTPTQFLMSLRILKYRSRSPTTLLNELWSLFELRLCSNFNWHWTGLLNCCRSKSWYAMMTWIDLKYIQCHLSLISKDSQIPVSLYNRACDQLISITKLGQKFMTCMEIHIIQKIQNYQGSYIFPLLRLPSLRNFVTLMAHSHIGRAHFVLTMFEKIKIFNKK